MAANATGPVSIGTGVLTPVPRDDAETVFAAPPSRPPTLRPPDPLAADTTGLPVSAGGKPPSGPLKVGQQFGARYHILKQLGIGGMGAVYQAWDSELEVAVALKVIRPEVTRDPVAAQDIERRFKQELLLARQVTHRNVVRIHDLGEIDGIKYITMPYIEGSDLSTVLRDKKLTVPQVLAIAREIAAGLQAAHEAGVVHRDLKPANVMIEKDHAIIMDFGIARSTSRGAPAPTRPPTGSAQLDLSKDDELTRVAATLVGEVIGTIEYMAPEQARGEHVDQRADVYAFGLIVYDMLVGRRRSEHAVSAVGELQGRLAHAPPSVRSVVPAVPEALDALVTKCVEPDAEKRFQSTAELVAALDLLDDNGKLKPKKRAIRLPYAVATAVLLLTLSVGVWWYQRQFIPPPTHDPVSVVIADFQNTTGDATFNDTLETAMQRALEGAGFITAFDRAGIRRTLGVVPPEKLDEAAALALAVQQGVGVVVSGAVEPQNRGFHVSVRAVRAVTGELIVATDQRPSNRDQVLASATQLATEVRQALGDDESESAQRFAMETLSATSIDVVREYALAMEALSRSAYADALQGFSKAVERDPNFGLAYAGMAISEFNLYRQQSAAKYAGEAITKVAGMTERERYRTRGLYYLVTSDYQSCVKEYGDLIKKYEADAAARNNLALCSTQLRDWKTALQEMRRAVQILPRRALYHGNLAVYLSYASEFKAAEEEARGMQEPTLLGMTALALAQIGQGQLSEARQTYQALDKFNGGGSRRASGLGDLAIYDGHYTEAEKILVEGAAADMKEDNADKAAAKLVALAQARVLRGEKRLAIAAVDQALKASPAFKIRFLGGVIAAQVGDSRRAKELAANLGMEFLAEPRAYGKIIEGEIEIAAGEPKRAIPLLTEANGLFDTWLGHYALGRAYLDAKQWPQADSEFDRCIGRRGEVLSLFLDEEPTAGFLPAAYYFQGRVREGGGSKSAESYGQYLAIRGQSTEDQLVLDVRKRLGR
jgi:serine/threonine protein kinase/tetratricopeptide (TPR) repeat protein